MVITLARGGYSGTQVYCNSDREARRPFWGLNLRSEDFWGVRKYINFVVTFLG